MATFALHDLEYGEPRRREGALRRVGPRDAPSAELAERSARPPREPGRRLGAPQSGLPADAETKALGTTTKLRRAHARAPAAHPAAGGAV